MPVSDDVVTNGAWHLDRRVPLALVVMIALQTLAAIWWASQIDNRVSILEGAVVSLQPTDGRIIRNETKIELITTSLTRIEDKLDQVLRSGAAARSP